MSTVLPQPVTYAAYRQLEADDNLLYELIEGEIVKKAAPSPRHQRVLLNLTFAIRSHLQLHPVGQVFFAPLDVFLDEHNAPQPDLLFVSAARSGIVTDDGIRGAPDLVVEVISPSSIVRDRVDKMKLYARFQVPEYWLVDPNNQSVEVYRYAEGAYELGAFAAQAGTVTSGMLPGLVLDVANLFGD